MQHHVLGEITRLEHKLYYSKMAFFATPNELIMVTRAFNKLKKFFSEKKVEKDAERIIQSSCITVKLESVIQQLVLLSFFYSILEVSFYSECL
jgi:hypothetical protein